MTTKTKITLAGACFLPSLACILNGLSLAIFLAPFMLVFSLTGAFCLYNFLCLFKFSQRIRAHIVLVFSLLGSLSLGYSLYYEKTAEGTLKRFVEVELPEGIEFTHHEGEVPMAGGSEELVFLLPKGGFDKMISQTEFKISSQAEFVSWVNFWWSKTELARHGIEPMYFYRLSDTNNPNMSGIWIVTNKSKTIVYLCRYKV